MKLNHSFLHLIKSVWFGGPLLILISYFIHLKEGVHFNFKENSGEHSYFEKDVKIISWSYLKQNIHKREPLIGRKIAIPGYVVPLNAGVQGLNEVLFVPSLQSCFHVPALREDEIIFASLSKNFLLAQNENKPHWLVGFLKKSDSMGHNKTEETSYSLLMVDSKLIALQK